MPRLLFILKHRESAWGAVGYHMSSGLRNSVFFLVEMLQMLGIEAKMVEVIDNNGIDREVFLYKPTTVIIEAFWVVPEKFDILMKLHPTVSWAVRDHSETPFIANEGIFADWTAGYLSRGIEIMANAPRALLDLESIAIAFGYEPNMISYAPNYYPVHRITAASLQPRHSSPADPIRVGCFGAIRPLKNHLVQAVASLRYAHALGKKLEFHINSSRVEGGANPILRNLRGLFANTPRAQLVEAPWLDHDQFLLLMAQMDIALQVSFSETFNIVSADAVGVGVPVIASAEVPWLGAYGQADPTSSTSILNQMLALRQISHRDRLIDQWRDLTRYCMTTKRVWWERFGGRGEPPAGMAVGALRSGFTMDARRPAPPPPERRPSPPDPRHGIPSQEPASNPDWGPPGWLDDERHHRPHPKPPHEHDHHDHHHHDHDHHHHHYGDHDWDDN